MKNTIYIMCLGFFFLLACNSSDEQTQEKKSEKIEDSENNEASNQFTSACDCAKWLADELKLAIEKADGDVKKFDLTYSEFMKKMDENKECEQIMQTTANESSLEEFTDSCPEMAELMDLQESLKMIFSSDSN
tara:strand:+ start:105 stop:503 length:399 start_codon:yes stop_codon:yes gene_type:complete